MHCVARYIAGGKMGEKSKKNEKKYCAVAGALISALVHLLLLLFIALLHRLLLHSSTFTAYCCAMAAAYITTH
jgi:hypothetical protein